MVTLEIVSNMHDETIYLQNNDVLEDCYDATRRLVPNSKVFTCGGWQLSSGRLPPTQPVQKHRLIPLVQPGVRTVEDKLLGRNTDVRTIEETVRKYFDDEVQCDIGVANRTVPETVDVCPPAEGQDTSDPYAQLNIRVRS